ncbi:MAG: helix-turn-helix domain-containing protein, partial [Candidatus Omnitrophota bacterium]
ILPEHIFIIDKIVSKNEDSIAQLQDLLAQFVKRGLQQKTSSLYKDIVEETEKALIGEALKQSQGNQSQTAKLLGISRPTLKDKIEKLNLRKVFSLEDGQQED